MHQLTRMDVRYLRAENDRIHSHISSLALCDPSSAPGGRLTLAGLRALFAERLPLMPPFRWRLAGVPLRLGRPYWVEDRRVDVRDHVRELSLPAPGDERQLAEAVAELQGRHLDRSRPLWEIWLIRGLRDGRVGVYTKTHHALSDGLAALELWAAVLDLSPEGREPPPAGTPGSERMPGSAELAARALAGRARALRSLRRGPRAPRGHARQGRVSSPRVPRAPFNGPISPHRSVAFGSLSLPAVKALRERYGITVNEVVLATCAGALMRRLPCAGRLPAEPLVARVPVSLRPQEQQQAHGNHVAFARVTIPTDERDPESRLALVQRASERVKGEAFAKAESAVGAAPAVIVARWLRRTLRRGGSLRENVVITAMRGPTVPLYLAGARLERFYPLAPLADGTALNIALWSHREEIDFSVHGDRELAPRVDDLRDAIEDELEDLCTLLVGTPVRGSEPADRTLSPPA